MPPSKPGQPAAVDTLRISETEAAAILNQLDDQQIQKSDDLRDNRRVTLRLGPGLVIEVHQPGGTSSKFLVRPRNISRTGLAFIHGGFLHKDTMCNVLFNTRSAGRVNVRGRVVRCRHIRGNLHEIGLKLLDELDLGKAVQLPSNRPAALSTAANPKLTGKSLLVESNDDDRAFVHQLLEHVGLAVRSSATIGRGIEQFAAGPCDVIIVSLDPIMKPASELANTLRDRGYGGPILGLTASHSPQVVRAALGHGLSSVLTKPFGVQTLDHVLRRAMLGEGAGPIALLSEHDQQPMMQQLVNGFLEHLQAYCDQLDGLREKPGDEALIALSLSLKGASANLGYPLIAAAALRLYELASGQNNAQAIGQQIDELIELSLLARQGRA